MPDSAMNLYVNDHLSGAMLGSELAAQIRDRNEGTALGELMSGLAADIEADRRDLQGLADALDVSRNPVKQAGGWAAEKWSRIKFSGAGSGDAGHGNFMAIETLSLGVAGKRCLWRALELVADRYEPIDRADMARLIARADAQLEALENARLEAADAVFEGARN
jgi:hypothetical protein